MNENKTNPTYPLIETAADRLRTATGRPLSEVDLEAAIAGELTADDIRITPETLRAQAQVAAAAGYTQFGANLQRAAELTGVPNEELLHMYDQLRPGRCSYAELIALAETLEREYQAPETSQLVRQAAEVYRHRNLLKAE